MGDLVVMIKSGMDDIGLGVGFSVVGAFVGFLVVVIVVAGGVARVTDTVVLDVVVVVVETWSSNCITGASGRVVDDVVVVGVVTTTSLPSSTKVILCNEPKLSGSSCFNCRTNLVVYSASQGRLTIVSMDIFGSDVLYTVV